MCVGCVILIGRAASGTDVVQSGGWRGTGRVCSVVCTARGIWVGAQRDVLDLTCSDHA